MKNGIPIRCLPKPFQHAVTVTKWLRTRYLWIDSLCIIQDSIADWQKECGKMRHVYKNALCNIASTGASNSSGGLFFDRDSSLILASVLHASWEGDLLKGHFQLWDDDIWSHGVNRAPLNRRAWVVQERLLARRILHFGIQSLYFECHELEACETFPDGLPSQFHSNMRNQFKNLQQIENLVLEHNSDNYYRKWLKIGIVYMQCNLTKEGDKVVALSGVMEEFQSRFNETYLAGLSKSYFGEQLLWVVKDGCRQANGQPSVRPTVYRAPSWSWLSIDAAVAPCNPTFEPCLITVVKANIEAVSDQNPLGEIKSGVICIRGQLRSANLQADPNRRYEHLLFDSDENQVGRIRVSFDEAAIKPKDIYYTPIRTEPKFTQLDGLLLKPTGKTEAEFQRVGYFVVHDIDTYKTLMGRISEEMVTFTLV